MFGPVNLDLGVPRSGSSDPKSGLREAQVHTVSVKTHVIVATLIKMIKNGSNHRSYAGDKIGGGVREKLRGRKNGAWPQIYTYTIHRRGAVGFEGAHTQMRRQLQRELPRQPEP